MIIVQFFTKYFIKHRSYLRNHVILIIDLANMSSSSTIIDIKFSFMTFPIKKLDGKNKCYLKRQSYWIKVNKLIKNNNPKLIKFLQIEKFILENKKTSK